MLFQAISFGIGVYCFTFWVEPFVAEFGVGRGRVLLVFVTLQLTLGLLSPLAGRAMDQFDLRWLIIAGALCLAASLGLTSLANELWQIQLLFASLMVAGMLLSGPLAAQTLMARWFDRNRGLALGLSTVGTSVGGFVLPLVFTSLLGALGWRGTSLWLSLLVVILVVPAVWLVVRSSPQAAGLQPQSASTDGVAELPDQMWTLPELLRCKTFWLIICAFLPLATAFGGAQQNLGPFAADQAIAPTQAAWLVSVLSLSMICAKVFFGAMADRVDHRWLFMMALFACLVGLLQLSVDMGYNKLLFVAGLLGAAAGGFLPLLATIVSARFGTLAFGRVMGLVGPFTMLAAVGPWLTAQVRDQAGSYDPAWPLLMAVLIPALVAIVFLPSAAATRANHLLLKG
jgi:MFS family permease